ncbi:unnamed protein product [Trichobilharzia regenti]|nr:unnamed protein product [Trichobilharzia regenti]
MEKASAIGNTIQLFRLISETGGKMQMISGTISQKSGTIISSHDRRLKRWKEHYEEQFNWPTATFKSPNIQHLPEWDIDTGPPSLIEVTEAVDNLKQCKVTGSDGMTPDAPMDLTLNYFRDTGIDLLPGNNLAGLEYPDDVTFLGEGADKMQSLLDNLSSNLRMPLVPAKCKMMLQEWTTLTPSLEIGSDVVEHVGRFTYLRSNMSQRQRADH